MAQVTDVNDTGFRVGLEIRPRLEFSENFTLQPSDSIRPAYYTTQRNRLSLTYTAAWLKVEAALQEIHLWGYRGSPSKMGSINAYELYVEPRFSKRLSARVGRQGLTLDNGRLFSAAPWAQQGRVHEGIRLFYTQGIDTDLTVAFTRPYSDRFDAAYSPVASHHYKLLFVHHLHWRINKRYALTTINTLDIFDHPSNTDIHYARWTNGGRITFTQTNVQLTLNAYYQHGQHIDQENLGAYYLQPEISTEIAHMTLRLGAEILSGSRTDQATDRSRSFVPLYGVAWKFMGNMNFFTRFPSDVTGNGLVNPYLHSIYKLNSKISIRADGHLFYLQHTKRYLGLEGDFSTSYIARKDVDLNFGFSLLNPDNGMKLLGKIYDTRKMAYWTYLMVSYRPLLWQNK